MYDLAIIGGGTAGLVCAAGAAGLGARVALVERARLGGDCLWTGCVPSKALLHAARARTTFAAAMAHVRASQSAIAPHDSPERLKSLGVDVFIGHASFSSPRAIVVNESSELRFHKAVIATGSRPSIPAVAGLEAVPFLTTDTVFDLVDQPESLTILGGGPVGCELAQAFAWLGTHVTLIESAPHLLPREDPDAGAVIARALARDGVEIRTGTTIDRAPRDSTVLVAVGRAANVGGLGLDRAGIAIEDGRLLLNDRLQTTNPRVYGAGDVGSRYQFTHAADAFARIVVQNALFFGRRRAGRLVIPWCTFTSPEVAHVGATRADAESRGLGTITIPLSDVDRAVVDDGTGGFVRVHHDRGRLAGATIVAPAAGETIGIASLAMQAGLSLADLSRAVFPYPTMATAFRQAADVYQRSRLTPGIRKVLKYYFGGT